MLSYSYVKQLEIMVKYGKNRCNMYDSRIRLLTTLLKRDRIGHRRISTTSLFPISSHIIINVLIGCCWENNQPFLYRNLLRKTPCILPTSTTPSCRPRGRSGLRRSSYGCSEEQFWSRGGRWGRPLWISCYFLLNCLWLQKKLDRALHFIFLLCKLTNIVWTPCTCVFSTIFLKYCQRLQLFKENFLGNNCSFETL